MPESAEKEWYSNKDLYEMMVQLSKGLEATNAELGKTQTMIRDYNGLRKEVADVKTLVNSVLSVKKNLQWWATFAVAIAAAVVAFVR